MPADSSRHRLEIHFGYRGGSRTASLELAGEVLEQWAAELASVCLVPADAERFDVVLDGELIFSMTERGRRPEAGEINTIIESRLGPPPGFGS